MHYERIYEGVFLERPNRFIAYIEINGQVETVHVKNTGRCKELLQPGAKVFVQKADNPERKTQWDLIGVQKGDRMINMDSQIPNKVVEEWIRSGNLFENVTLVKPETTYGKSRFDLYIEADDRKIFMEIKGVTLEEDGVVRFPDAPTERGIKHLQELMQAKQDGYEAYVFFVIQMKDVKYFEPNMVTHAAFGEALRKASCAGVKVLAYDCQVGCDSIEIGANVPVYLDDTGECVQEIEKIEAIGPENEQKTHIKHIVQPIVDWYRMNKRDLPWRDNPTPYHVWVSEIMLQQTRVEAVKPFYARFLNELPDVKSLAEAKEDKILKLWEGLGYYNRVRNMQKAAQQVMNIHNGQFPEDYEAIRNLTGIGNYTAGAISSFAFGIPKPAVDGNVLRVISRITENYDDIMKASVRTRVEKELEEVIPADAASDFNQGLIELGAIVCVPNGAPKCEECPVAHLCKAKLNGTQFELPVKSKAKTRKIEEKTVFIFKDGENVAIRKRPAKGLLASLYELPNVAGHLSEKEALEYSQKIGLAPLHIKELGEAKHIFSHVEWHMIGYAIKVDELEKSCTEKMLFIHPEAVEKDYPIPAAFEKYAKCVNVILGQEKYE